eukprot:NP_001314910.1 uncharacterized protein LOC100192882 isoform 1 [Zea mays]
MPWWSTGIGTRTCVALLYPIFAGEVSGRSVQVVYVKHSFYFLSYYILLLPVRTGGVCLCGGAPGSGCSERPSASPSPCHLVNAPRHLADSPSCWLSARPLALGGVACRPVLGLLLQRFAMQGRRSSRTILFGLRNCGLEF